MLDKSIRELDRERNNLQNQEKRLVTDIKKMAKAGQLGATKIMAKDLVRTRHSITKFYGLKSQLQGVSLRMQTLKSTQAMADAMRGVTRAMSSMNKQLNLPSLNNIMREFERENEKMENTTEVMGDAIDDAMAADGEEEESEELVAQVLDELGVGMDAALVDAPRAAAKVAPVAAPSVEAAPVLVAEGARLALPVVAGDELWFGAWDGDACFEPAGFGALGPRSGAAVLRPDVVLAPLVD